MPETTRVVVVGNGMVGRAHADGAWLLVEGNAADEHAFTVTAGHAHLGNSKRLTRLAGAFGRLAEDSAAHKCVNHGAVLSWVDATVAGC